MGLRPGGFGGLRPPSLSRRFPTPAVVLNRVGRWSASIPAIETQPLPGSTPRSFKPDAGWRGVSRTQMKLEGSGALARIGVRFRGRAQFCQFGPGGDLGSGDLRGTLPLKTWTLALELREAVSPQLIEDAQSLIRVARPELRQRFLGDEFHDGCSECIGFGLGEHPAVDHVSEQLTEPVLQRLDEGGCAPRGRQCPSKPFDDRVIRRHVAAPARETAPRWYAAAPDGSRRVVLGEPPLCHAAARVVAGQRRAGPPPASIAQRSIAGPPRLPRSRFQPVFSAPRAPASSARSRGRTPRPSRSRGPGCCPRRRSALRRAGRRTRTSGDR